MAESKAAHGLQRKTEISAYAVRLLISRGADLNLHCRLAGHYERPQEVFVGTVLDYARQFPGEANGTLEELTRAASETLRVQPRVET